MAGVEYFDQKVETASPDEILMLQFKKLETLLKKVYASNPFYQEKFKRQGISPQDIRYLDDLHKLPFTMKREFEEDQETSSFWNESDRTLRRLCEIPSDLWNHRKTPKIS